MRYPRDMRGYGAKAPKAPWPDEAAIAVQFVVNYEEGGENNILHGDSASEAFLSEIVGAAPWPDQRHWNMESLYEYGARRGFWRLHELFTSHDIPVTVYGVATALQRAPEQVNAMLESNWEIASHGLKWIDYKDHSKEEERADIIEAISLHEKLTGAKPQGWYTGRCSVNTVDLVAEQGVCTYQSDCYGDDLPYWHETPSGAQLMVPYTLDANDMRFATPQGFNTGDHFYQYLKDSFDTLYAEGIAGAPKMMSIGLHCRLIGRPGRIQSLRKFIDYVKSHDHIWFARRIDIANRWREAYPYQPRFRPSTLSKREFLSHFGGIYEHSDWIAERAFEAELAPAHDNPVGIAAALAFQFRAASEQERLDVLRAHPDLAGKLAQAKKLTAESTDEQASAGLDALTDAERATFTSLNEAYVARFGHPFIIAVKEHNKASILAAFHKRITHDAASEFQEACAQVEKIAGFRIRALFESQNG